VRRIINKYKNKPSMNIEFERMSHSREERGEERTGSGEKVS
jgi:hypothetical protein